MGSVANLGANGHASTIETYMVTVESVRRIPLDDGLPWAIYSTTT
jgi:hypothetical protein